MADARPSPHQPTTNQPTDGPLSGPSDRGKAPSRPRDIDFRMRGLSVAAGRRTDRFRCSSETRNGTTYKARVAMMRELGARIYEPHVCALVKAVLNDGLSVTELHVAYRRGETALHALVAHARAKKAPRLKQLIDDYIKEKRQRKPEQMRRTLRRFCVDAGGGLEQATTASLTRSTIAKFLADLTRQHPGHGVIGTAVSVGTVNRYRSAIGGFCSWLVREGYLTQHPIAHGQIPAHSEQGSERMPRFAPSEYAVYVEEFGRDGLGAEDPELRITALLLLHSGADVGEVLSRRVRDVRWGGGDALTRIWYRRTKTNTPERLVPVPAVVTTELRALVASYDLSPNDTLLGGVTPGRVRGAHRRALKKLKRTDLRVKDLRHIAAQFWREGGADLEQLREWLGHATLDQVRKYAAFGPKDNFDAPPVEKAVKIFTAQDGIPSIPRRAAGASNPAADLAADDTVPSEPAARRA